ncbi:MAG: MFS transporter [Balneola sp.]|nr:MFS transporter [Balneola sp.]|tara:strand:+ start:37046 stop:38311 length:1266 start_codon:yes stop_codon:yes gene_type:complete
MLKNLRPYLSLIKENHDFRRLWIAQSISNFGDWFGLLALYAIIGKYSDSEFLLGLIIVVKMLSLAFFSPIAGYFADRFNRRRLMIWCDLFRGLAVLGIILVQSESMLWLAYVLTALQMMLSAIFEPAKTSSIPNVTSEENLTNANIISTATWSIIFTTGMAIGGFATEWLGTDVVLILDSLTYVASAWFVYRAVIPQKRLSEEELYRTRNPFKGIQEGLSYLIKNRHILRPSLAKGFSTAFLGGLVYLLIIVSEEVLMMGSIGLGLLYAARGFGTGIGPIIGRRIFRDEKDWVTLMGLAITFCGMMYMVVGLVNSLPLMLIFVLLAHSASGANWVSSTVLLQKRTVDTFRGRIFSTEWLLFTIGSSISTVIASLILEAELMNVKSLIMVYGGMMALAGIFWSFTITQNEKIYQSELRSADQ